MGRFPDAKAAEFRCKICKRNFIITGTKDTINDQFKLSVKYHKELYPKCKATESDFSWVLKDIGEKEEDKLLVNAKKIIEFSQRKTAEILIRENPHPNDIVGNDDAKKILRDRLVEHVKYRARLQKNKMHDECGIILAGIQGTGKTKLVSAIVNTEIFLNEEFKKKFDILIMRASDFVMGNIGSTAKMISGILDTIRESNAETGKETILIVDEIDALLPRRKTDRISSKEKMSSILDEFGGIHDDHTVLVIGMTNLPDDIDSHVLVAGRFGNPILVNIPTAEERWTIFVKYKGELNLEEEITSEFINENLGKFTGRDMFYFLKDLHKIFFGKEERGEHSSSPVITQEDIITLLKTPKYRMTNRKNLEMVNELSKYFNKYNETVRGAGSTIAESVEYFEHAEFIDRFPDE